MKTDMQISFIILSWNSAPFLRKCFESIFKKCKQDDVTFEIIIIDNGSRDNTISLIQDARQQAQGTIKPIFLKKNTGTTYSRNLGLAQSTGDIICILDSDTELLDGSLHAIFTLLNKDRKIGILAPRLILQNEIVQNSVKKFPTFIHKLSKIKKIILGTSSIDKDFYTNFPFDELTYVDTAISACWFFRRDLLDDVGTLDERIFYAPEDLDYCARVIKAGYEVAYYPDFTIFHDTQQITHQNPFSKLSMSHFVGLLYYFRKHGGWFSTSSYR